MTETWRDPKLVPKDGSILLVLTRDWDSVYLVLWKGVSETDCAGWYSPQGMLVMYEENGISGWLPAPEIKDDHTLTDRYIAMSDAHRARD